MNFLAHLYLSGDSDEFKIGNFIGDFVKGKQYLKYPPKIQTGIMLHRHIDHFTDTSQSTAIKSSKKRLNKKYNKYSSIVIDVFYDHFLATNWNNYSEQPLEYYVNNCYELFTKKKNILPDIVQKFLPKMIKINRLASYSTIEGIQNALKTMSNYTSLPDETDFAIEILINEYDNFGKEFNIFFPQVIKFVENKYQINGIGNVY
jgi:acyl carrier protein phosphodiesterase